MDRKLYLEWVSRNGNVFTHHSRVFDTREEYLDALEQLTKDRNVVRISCDGMDSLRNWPFCDI